MTSRRQGFTLVELLLSLGVLAIGLATLFSLLPGVSAYSRGLREERRLSQFAEAVFLTLSWQLEDRSGLPDGVPDADKARLPTVTGIQSLVVSGEEQLWPDTGMAEAPVPVFYYTLQLQSNDVRRVEATLKLRPAFDDQVRIYRRTLYPQVGAW